MFRLYFLSFRLAGVYGPGEMVILGRSLRVIQSGILRETLSQKLDLKIDFVHIKNVVQAHVKVSWIHHYIGDIFNCAIPGLFLAIFVISTFSMKSVHYKILPMAGFEQWNSGVGSDCSANWATTSAQPSRGNI